MTEIETKTEAETEDFAGNLSDEALDRAEGAYCGPMGCVLCRAPLFPSSRMVAVS